MEPILWCEATSMLAGIVVVDAFIGFQHVLCILTTSHPIVESIDDMN